MYALVNCTIYTGESILNSHAVIIENDLIKATVLQSDLDISIHCIDLNGANLCAGFIDLQLNGCGGVMFNGAETEQTLTTMQTANRQSGTTSFLPTFITDSDEGIKKALSAVQRYINQTKNEVLGIHLEGPYINPLKKGIHPTQHVRKSDHKMIDFICDHADIVKQLTLAPEIISSTTIKQLTKAGILVSIGHSNANYQQAVEAINQGVSSATHLFNAMSPLTGREPGIVGAVYDKKIYAGIIVDGFHVDYANVRISKNILQDKLFLVTDATAPAGANIEKFDFVGTTVYYKEGKCFGEDGTLGGSAVTMIESVEQCVKLVGITLDEAIRMATLYPAKAISVDDKLGSITKDKIANLTIFNNNYKVTATVVNGVYQTTQK